MKFNWGHAIVLVLVLFGLWIGTMVYMSAQQRIDLVTENYYDTENAYQERQLRSERADKLSEKMEIKTSEGKLNLQFPSDLNLEAIEGTLTFYNPRDQRLDFELALQKGSLSQSVDISKVARGKWTIKVDLPGEQGYYFEETLFL